MDNREYKKQKEEEARTIRQSYVNGWNETMVKIWRDRIMSLNVIDTGNLFNSVSALPVAHDGRFLELLITHKFVEYGLYQDFGVGREKWKGNPGDYLATNPNNPNWSSNSHKERERRKWFSTKYYSSVMNLNDFLAESMGHEFIGIISDALTRIDKA